MTLRPEWHHVVKWRIRAAARCQSPIHIRVLICNYILLPPTIFGDSYFEEEVMLLSIIIAAVSQQQIALAAVLGLFLYAAVYHLNDGLAHIPAVHWSAKWSRCHALCTKYFWSTKLDYLRAHKNSHGQHGFRPLIRVAPNEVSVMASEGIKIAWGGGFERSSWYEAFANFGYVSHTTGIRLDDRNSYG